MDEITNLLTSGLTSVAVGTVLVYLVVNAAKIGWLGKLSRWLESAKNKKVYGGRVLALSIFASLIINLIQWAAMAGAETVWTMLLRVITCSFLASGVYEHIKAVSNNLKGEGVDDLEQD